MSHSDSAPSDDRAARRLDYRCAIIDAFENVMARGGLYACGRGYTLSVTQESTTEVLELVERARSGTMSLRDVDELDDGSMRVFLRDVVEPPFANAADARRLD